MNDQTVKNVRECIDWFRHEFGRDPRSNDDFRWVTVRAKQMDACPRPELSEDEKMLNRFSLETDVVEN